MNNKLFFCFKREMFVDKYNYGVDCLFKKRINIVYLIYIMKKNLFKWNIYFCKIQYYILRQSSQEFIALAKQCIFIFFINKNSVYWDMEKKKMAGREEQTQREWGSEAGSLKYINTPIYPYSPYKHILLLPLLRIFTQ